VESRFFIGGGFRMKGYTFFDRQSRKSFEGLVVAHLQEEYRLPPLAARALTEDVMVFGRVWNVAVRGAGQVLYHAVEIGQPAGKPLRRCRMQQIRLTVHEPKDMEVRKERGLYGLTCELVSRLCREAVEQGTVLSVEDLSEVLHVSVATVKRIKKELVVQGRPAVTRGDVSDMGPGTTHRERIVKLYLQGYSETDIARRTNHSLGCTESYVRDFVRVSILGEDGYSPAEICRLAGLSAGKVRAHLDLYHRLSGDEFYEGALKRVISVHRLARGMTKKGAVPCGR
jgi:DNA-binding CsgD family transcriptional regulator